MRGGREGREEAGRDGNGEGAGREKTAGKVEGGLDLDICPAAAEFL